MISLIVTVILAAQAVSGLNTSCVTTATINMAFQTARLQTGFSSISSSPSEYELDRLGRTLLAVTSVIAKQCGLTAEEVYSSLPAIDTSATDINSYCPTYFRPYNCTAQRYREYDGHCNNLANPTWGAAYANYRRWFKPGYSDGVASIRAAKNGSSLPSVRDLSLNVHKDTNTVDKIWTTMFVGWGQLIDHDMVDTVGSTDSSGKDLTCCSGTSTDDACLAINMTSTDSFYSAYKVTCLEFSRNAVSPKQGCRLGVRDQFNRLTSVLDASFVYGTTKTAADSLRTFSGGKLKTQAFFASQGLKDLPPQKTANPDSKCFRPNSTSYCFLTGDDRSNQQPMLTIPHVIFMREHNRIAAQLQTINPQWSDETIFQETRHIVAALVQKITYDEYLPSLLGKDNLATYGLDLLTSGYYTGYNASINPTLPDVFNTAAFRFGHSMVPSQIARYNSSHSLLGSKYLYELFWQPWDLYKAGYFDNYLVGLLDQLAYQDDESLSDQLTNRLDQTPATQYGSDLASRNILRGRDHGLPTYNAVRSYCGLSTFSSWNSLVGTFRNSTIRTLSALYQSPDDLDLWTAGVAEVPVPKLAIGPTFTCIVAETFKNLRNGDRFWFENGGWPSSFTTDQLTEIRKVRLARVLCDNSDSLSTIQLAPMFITNETASTNPRVSCTDFRLPSMNLNKWKA